MTLVNVHEMIMTQDALYDVGHSLHPRAQHRAACALPARVRCGQQILADQAAPDHHFAFTPVDWQIASVWEPGRGCRFQATRSLVWKLTRSISAAQTRSSQHHGCLNANTSFISTDLSELGHLLLSGPVCLRVVSFGVQWLQSGLTFTVLC